MLNSHRFIMILFALTGAATSSSWNLRWSSSNGSADPFDTIPPKVPFNPHLHVGLPGSHAVGNFVRTMGSANFGTTYTATVPSTSGGDPCTLDIRPVVTSHALQPRQKQKSSWYPIALITNSSNQACEPRALGVKQGESAVWIVYLEPGPDTAHASIGGAGVVVLAPPSSGHDRWSTGASWSFRQCGHPGSPYTTDQALIWLGSDVCTKTRAASHNSAQIAADLRDMVRTNPKLGDNPILWFACGGDCCYSDLGQ